MSIDKTKKLTARATEPCKVRLYGNNNALHIITMNDDKGKK